MPLTSKRSLASWREANGFGILTVIDPRGEHFFVEISAAPGATESSWSDMSESQLRAYLEDKGFLADAIDDAVGLSREWATTTTSSRPFARRPRT